MLFVGLYAGQGVVGSLVQSGLPVVMRSNGIGLDRIGWLGLLFLPWVLKFLWAPVLDRYGIWSLGHRRSWILLCQALTISALAAAAFLSPTEGLIGVALLLGGVICIAATQDTATDALAVEALAPEKHLLGGTMQVAGGYLGFALGIGLWLPIYQHIGWSAAMLAAAGCVLLGSLPLWLAGNIEGPQRRSAVHATGAPLKASFASPTIRRGLLFIVFYQVGSRIGIAMLGPFFVDAGLSLDTIGLIKGTVGPLVGFAGALASGWLLKFATPRTALQLAALLHAAVYLALAGVAATGVGDPTVLGVLGALEAFSFSLVFVALYTAMMGWCSPIRAGTDFAVLQSADALLAVIASLVAGQIGHSFGHSVNFALAAGLLTIAAFPAMRLLPTISR
ncbi:hypothetical protein VZ95_01215 [Elstera litoralis]|uniref:MFS transporter n=1 Tax=Elstera litoralis TaxID=552518 RepID=A0A0F3IWJ3_9PROT|nr:hypothetical protein VZ95_01215 [Elstera litoralis]